MQGQSPCPRSAERGTLLCSFKRRRGSKGEPSPGVPPFLCLLRVRRYAGRWSLACPAIRPHFFGACPKKRCRAAKEKRFLPRRLHHPRERSCFVDGTFLARLGRGAWRLSEQLPSPGANGIFMAASRGRSSSRVSLSLSGPAHHQSEFLWGSTPFLCARAKKWGGTGSRERNFSPGKRRIRTNAKNAPYGGAFVSVCFSR